MPNITYSLNMSTVKEPDLPGQNYRLYGKTVQARMIRRDV